MNQYKYIIFFTALLLASISYANPVLTGRYFYINNSRIYAEVYGKGPTVIFESGLGDGISSWSKIVPTILTHSHIILYDRAGIGKTWIRIISA